MNNYTYHGTANLIALPGRSVQTFPSGLVRVDRTYACRAADAGKYRQQFAAGNILPLDDGTPAIDGLYIFPDAQEEKGSDGFYRFKVSGYGRVNTTGTVQSFFEEGTFRYTTGGAGFVLGACVNEVAIISYVVPNTNNPVNNQPPNIPLRVFVRGNGTFVPIEVAFAGSAQVIDTGGTLGLIRINTTVTITNTIEDSPGTVFGAWKEVVYKIRAGASVDQVSVSQNN